MAAHISQMPCLAKGSSRASYRNPDHLLSYLAAIWRDGASDFSIAIQQHKLSHL